jgi:hypothetical protein
VAQLIISFPAISHRSDLQADQDNHAVRQGQDEAVAD